MFDEVFRHLRQLGFCGKCEGEMVRDIRYKRSDGDFQLLTIPDQQGIYKRNPYSRAAKPQAELTEWASGRMCGAGPFDENVRSMSWRGGRPLPSMTNGSL